MKNVSVQGTYVAARLAQGYVYAVIQQPSYKFNNHGNATSVLPVAAENGVRATLAPSSVYYTPNRVQISYYTMVVSMSMSTGKQFTSGCIFIPRRFRTVMHRSSSCSARLGMPMALLPE